MVNTTLKYVSISAAVFVGLYATLLGLLSTSFCQAHVVYLHGIQMTWFKDLNVPELFGFLHNQVSPFGITSWDGETLYAWHILPVGLYRKHEEALVPEPSGFVLNIKSRLSFKLLQYDPEARLVLYFHGAGGTVGSGYRTLNYRALSAGQPDNIHVLTFDYRGFGRSTGNPSERGLLLDAIAVVEWVTIVAGIYPSRIVVFGQSMGTAVALAMSEHFALQSPPVVFAGTVLVAPLVDVATLVSTYKIAGTIPLLSSLARFPTAFAHMCTLIRDKLTLIHAEDDWDIPFHHTQLLFWHAVNATVPGGISYETLEDKKYKAKVDLGAAGSLMEWRTEVGVIREDIMQTGLHDVIMGYPVITIAVMRIFD
ncbi:Alpha/Beta hydrolase protein [Rhexocercosporidium sp. MPI-PUGE-AT-0058]|nr:Alpha/Beta hydrolase protein [Rhexocercosporidium sp. MPI-PUGE-AT-0058]